MAALCAGGSLGTLLRFWLGTQLNGLFPSLPPGTLAANWIGAYIVGVAIAAFSAIASLAPEWRLLVITGFCGGLTTFSTFSAEVVQLLQQSRLGLALASVALHLFGSLAMTFAGIGTVLWLRSV